MNEGTLISSSLSGHVVAGHKPESWASLELSPKKPGLRVNILGPESWRNLGFLPITTSEEVQLGSVAKICQVLGIEPPTWLKPQEPPPTFNYRLQLVNPNRVSDASADQLRGIGTRRWFRKPRPSKLVKSLQRFWLSKPDLVRVELVPVMVSLGDTITPCGELPVERVVQEMIRRKAVPLDPAGARILSAISPNVDRFLDESGYLLVGGSECWPNRRDDGTFVGLRLLE